MKIVIGFIGLLFILIAILAIPIAIGAGLYDWVIVDVEFKIALWECFKLWAVMSVSGMLIGAPCYFYASS